MMQFRTAYTSSLGSLAHFATSAILFARSPGARTSPNSLTTYQIGGRSQQCR
jgi:hypothetical protein